METDNAGDCGLIVFAVLWSGTIHEFNPTKR
jgi:hypothetical protein